MPGLGEYPLGEGLGPFGGPGLITIKGIIATASNEISVVLDRIPKLVNDGAWNDASDPNNYLLFAIDPTEITETNEVYIPPGKFVATHPVSVVSAKLDVDDPTQILLTTDCALEKFVDYELTMLYVRGAEGEDYAGPTSFSFRALTMSVKPASKSSLVLAVDPYNDIANNFYALDKNGAPALTGWQLTNDMNLAHHGGLANARKRIHRRLFAGRGRYLIYGSGYGTNLPHGQVARPGDLRRLESAITEQIRQEPDVLDVLVVANITATNMVDISARTEVRKFGITTVRQVVAL